VRGTSLGRTAAPTRAGMSALRARAPGGPERRERKNYAGHTVESHAGPAAALAVALGAARVRPAAGMVIAGAAHFVNLVEVRPGRAADAVVALGVPDAR
jgi:hypothetical protein